MRNWSVVETLVWGDGSIDREIANIIRDALSDPRREIRQGSHMYDIHIRDVGPWPDDVTIRDVLDQPDESWAGAWPTCVYALAYDVTAHAYREAIDGVGGDISDPDDRVNEATIASLDALETEDARDFVARHGGES